MKKLFGDLEKIRLEIIREKLTEGYSEFELDNRMCWNSIKLEKPLFETLLRLVEEALND